MKGRGKLEEDKKSKRVGEEKECKGENTEKKEKRGDER